MKYIGNFDGSAFNNPGPIGLGAVIFVDGTEINSAAVPMPDGTNNEAEYQALILLLKRAIKAGIRDLSCFGDSKLVVEQINGRWAVNKPELKVLCNRALQLMREFNQVTVEWVKRDKNTRADELSKLAQTVGEPVFVGQQITPKINNKAIAQHEVVSDKNSQSVGKPFFVRKLNAISYIIVQGGNTCILTQLKTGLNCSCSEFSLAKSCLHAKAFSKICIEH